MLLFKEYKKQKQPDFLYHGCRAELVKTGGTAMAVKWVKRRSSFTHSIAVLLCYFF